ncbi:hypothetical protein MTO96_020737 [Rhipicephalus appendiculatus]
MSHRRRNLARPRYGLVLRSCSASRPKALDVRAKEPPRLDEGFSKRTLIPASASTKSTKDRPTGSRETSLLSLCKVRRQRCSLQRYRQGVYTPLTSHQAYHSHIEDRQHAKGVQIQCRIGQENEALVTTCTSSHLGGESVAPATYAFVCRVQLAHSTIKVSEEVK